MFETSHSGLVRVTGAILVNTSKVWYSVLKLLAGGYQLRENIKKDAVNISKKVLGSLNRTYVSNCCCGHAGVDREQ